MRPGQSKSSPSGTLPGSSTGSGFVLGRWRKIDAGTITFCDGGHEFCPMRPARLSALMYSRSTAALQPIQVAPVRPTVPLDSSVGAVLTS